MKHITYKFNGGNIAILCDKCRTIIKTSIDFTKEEKELQKLPAQYCDKCKKK